MKVLKRLDICTSGLSAVLLPFHSLCRTCENSQWTYQTLFSKFTKELHTSHCLGELQRQSHYRVWSQIDKQNLLGLETCRCLYLVALGAPKKFDSRKGFKKYCKCCNSSMLLCIVMFVNVAKCIGNKYRKDVVYAKLQIYNAL